MEDNIPLLFWNCNMPPATFINLLSFHHFYVFNSFIACFSDVVQFLLQSFMATVPLGYLSAYLNFMGFITMICL